MIDKYDEKAAAIVTILGGRTFSNEVEAHAFAVVMLARVLRDARAEAFEEAAKDFKCLSSQLPGNGACSFEDGEDDGPCELCVSAARLIGKADALRIPTAQEKPHG